MARQIPALTVMHPVSKAQGSSSRLLSGRQVPLYLNYTEIARTGIETAKKTAKG